MFDVEHTVDAAQSEVGADRERGRSVVSLRRFVDATRAYVSIRTWNAFAYHVIDDVLLGCHDPRRWPWASDPGASDALYAAFRAYVEANPGDVRNGRFVTRAGILADLVAFAASDAAERAVDAPEAWQRIEARRELEACAAWLDALKRGGDAA